MFFSIRINSFQEDRGLRTSLSSIRTARFLVKLVLLCICFWVFLHTSDASSVYFLRRSCAIYGRNIATPAVLQALPLVLHLAALKLKQQGKTNLSRDGLNPAHVPCWWVNNPTLGASCYTTRGRADIEESTGGVAMNARPPQASYPCGNFSVTLLL